MLAVNLLTKRLSCLGSDLHLDGGRSFRADGGVVVGDLPIAIDLAPHVRETRLDWGASISIPQFEGVQAGVEVGVAVAVDLDAVIGDGTEGVLLHEALEVLLRVAVPAALLDVSRRDRGQEGEVGGDVHVGHGERVLGLEGVVPALEIGLPRQPSVRI